MKRLFLLPILLSAPISWVAEFEDVDFDKGLICDSENHRYVVLIETYLWLDVPDKVWVSYDADFREIYRVNVEIDESHVIWKHNDFFSPEAKRLAGDILSLRHQLDLQNLLITSTKVDTGAKYQTLRCDIKTRSILSKLATVQHQK